jgi:hypothetical protein
MKRFDVFMCNNATVPLDGSDRQPGQIKSFDQEEDAMTYASSVRKKWDCVKVSRTADNVEIACFRGDYKYVGKKKTRVENV